MTVWEKGRFVLWTSLTSFFLIWCIYTKIARQQEHPHAPHRPPYILFKNLKIKRIDGIKSIVFDDDLKYACEFTHERILSFAKTNHLNVTQEIIEDDK